MRVTWSICITHYIGINNSFPYSCTLIRSSLSKAVAQMSGVWGTTYSVSNECFSCKVCHCCLSLLSLVQDWRVLPSELRPCPLGSPWLVFSFLCNAYTNTIISFSFSRLKAHVSRIRWWPVFRYTSKSFFLSLSLWSRRTNVRHACIQSFLS